jgi:enoyl-CoA hydratase/carnithine racemase
MGLVNHVVESHELESFTHGLAREISENAPLSLQGTKFALHKMAASPVLHERNETMLRSLFVQSLQSEDMAEAKEAFLNKRKPRFKGK